MKLLIEILLAVLVGALNFVLVRMIAPVRVGLLARLIRNERNVMTLQIAVQNLHVLPVEGPIVIDVLIERPGALLPGVKTVGFYGGPDSEYPGALNIQRTREGMSISIGRLRGVKTWTFEVECTSATRRVLGVLRAPRRPLGDLFGLPESNRLERLFDKPALIFWSVEPDFSDPKQPKLWQTFSYESSLVLLVLLATGIACYTAAVVYMQSDEAWTFVPDSFDVFIVGTFACVVCALFFISRPRLHSIAQGYLERQERTIEDADQSLMDKERELDHTYIQL